LLTFDCDELYLDTEVSADFKSKQAKKIERFNGILEKRQAKRSEQRRRCKANSKLKPAYSIQIPRLEVCLDLSFCDLMSVKELRKLARQMGRVWGLQKKYNGLNTTLCSPPDQLITACEEVLDGFSTYKWNIVQSDGIELPFAKEKTMVYLSPDADLSPLLDLTNDCIYVIGGLVDESGKGKRTSKKAEHNGHQCFRLPIPEFMEKTNKGTFNLMLTINQAFEILCRFAEKQDWRYALEIVPRRIGYCLRDDTVSEPTGNG